MRVLKEIPIITFSLWCTRLLASLVRICGKNHLKIGQLPGICLGKVVNRKLPFSNFLELLLVLVQVVYLTNRSTDKHETW